MREQGDADRQGRIPHQGVYRLCGWVMGAPCHRHSSEGQETEVIIHELPALVDTNTPNLSRLYF